ncbi:MAG: hypothetical protein A2901_07820 [Elusimicrobia bacterium RIFCSPLOWO2_01_FULL_54_10]|nr:MAG: hypothetical protein A2901_07820 [Elusimicrobia bacterium RIFCSPLOWO2_01_FULL_54_10]
MKNLFTNYLTTFLGLALGFILIPFLIHKLGKDAYGLIVLAESTIAFFEMASVSIRMSLSRFATLALAQNKKNEFESYLSTVRVILIVSSLLVLAVGLGLSASFDRIFQVPAQFHSQSRALFLLISIAFATSIPNMVYWSVLYANHRYDLINMSTTYGIIFRAASLLLIFSFLPSRYVSITTYGLVYVLTLWIQNLAVYLWVRKIMPGLKIAARSFNAVKAKEVLAYSGYVGLGQASGLLKYNVTAILINLFWGPAYNAIYAVGMKFPSILTRLFEEATWSLTSTFQELVAQDDRGKIRRLYYLYTKFVTLVTAPICFTLIFIAKPLILLWVGADFIYAATLLPILLVPLFFQIPLGVSGCLIQAHGKIKMPSVGSLIAACGSILLGIVLARVFDLGLIGFAVSHALVSCFYMIGFSSWYACKISGIPVIDYWQKAMILPWLWSAIMSFGCFFLMERLLAEKSYALAGLTLIGSIFIYGIAAYWVVLDSTEKEQLDKVFKFGQKRFREGVLGSPLEAL